ncbi:hypothetical protein NSK_007202 [Nannochloropsis salina CCMP1776]|uniref:JmjC domain-containing protein n=1 Tax=Nannochloropsis salina CCMP1776 TaxID=1027361 RepID=A0A4D9CQT4_9STRA|nr:hypothetical protein NSK_007202 [Nannochloropsis salina CCMP1776]|eukprot:TFJ81480.1 hypothetical protein NSK_007202 [Nannochloropsis salina CCMP1776]
MPGGPNLFPSKGSGLNVEQQDWIDEALQALHQDVEDFWVPQAVCRLTQPISALTFLRDFVQPSIPVVFCQGSGLMGEDWGLETWKDWKEIVEKIGGERLVSVNVTPDGRGDAILGLREWQSERGSGRGEVDDQDGSRNASGDAQENSDKPNSLSSPRPHPTSRPQRVFVKPEERRMTFASFVKTLLQASGGEEQEKEVMYLSQQDDNLRREFPELLGKEQLPDKRGGGQVPANGFPLAQQAFGSPPDAINLWIGDARSISSLHKDPYENMYAVLKGEKHFTLFPPSDVSSFLFARGLPQASYAFDSIRACFQVNLDGREKGSTNNGRVDWVDLEASKAAAARRGEREGGREEGREERRERVLHPLEVRVKEGEVLYLPALWYHEVTQTCPTVAVNFWHDMCFFGPKYVYFNFLQRLGPTQTSLPAFFLLSTASVVGPGTESGRESGNATDRDDSALTRWKM